jgi:hypothetical protein
VVDAQERHLVGGLGAGRDRLGLHLSSLTASVLAL